MKRHLDCKKKIAEEQVDLDEDFSKACPCLIIGAWL